MKLHYYGDLEEFEHFVTDLQLLAWVRELPKGVYQVRCCDGGNMNWSSTSKRIWFDGDPNECRKLEDSVIQYLTVEHRPQFKYHQ
jgi:hypothetical protein